MKINDVNELSHSINSALVNTVPGFTSLPLDERDRISRGIANGLVNMVQSEIASLKEQSDKLEEERKELEVNKLVTERFIDKLKELKLTLQV